MKILHAIGWYFPESSGGTEVYVEGLTRHLAALGIDSEVLVGQDGSATAWSGIPISRYGSERGDGDQSLTRFRDRVRASGADVFHLHSWTPGCGPEHLRIASDCGLKTVVTIHVPGVVCPRGTMMLNGERACDGRIEVSRCTKCWGASRGIPGPVAAWQGRLPRISTSLGRLLPTGRLGTALATPDLVRERYAQLLDLAAEADRLVAVCRWLFDALVVNGLPAQKLVYSAQGVELASAPPRLRRADAPLRIGYLGRWDPVKGVHVIADAVKQLPSDVRAELVIHGLRFDDDYEAAVSASVADEPRITLAAPVSRADLPVVLASFDLLAVPSLWLETGPLVVLEAFSVGTPVIGSRLGGIAELVPPGYGNILLPPGDVSAWSNAIRERAAERRGDATAPPLPRSMSAVATDMAAVYREVIAGSGRIQRPAVHAVAR